MVTRISFIQQGFEARRFHEIFSFFQGFELQSLKFEAPKSVGFTSLKQFSNDETMIMVFDTLWNLDWTFELWPLVYVVVVVLRRLGDRIDGFTWFWVSLEAILFDDFREFQFTKSWDIDDFT